MLIKESIFMTKRFKSTLIVFLSLLMMTTNIQALDKNIHLNLYAITEAVSSGDKANFVLEVKTTGSKADLKDVEITLDLPASFNLYNNLEELNFFGVTPELQDQQLKYYFEDLKTGMNERKVLQFQTRNGYELNQDEVILSAEIKVAEETYAETSAKTIINSAGSIDVAKNLKSIDGKTIHQAPAANDTLNWELRISSNKRSNGQMFLKEGSQIKVVDTLPTELEYVSDSHNGIYDQASNTVTWFLDAPSYQEQEAEDKHLFVETIEIKTKTKAVSEETYMITIENTLSAEGTLINDQVVNNATSASVIMSDGKGKVPEVHGSYYYGGHRGPLNGDGVIAPTTDKNPVPRVYDTARLGFLYQYFIQRGPGSVVFRNGNPFIIDANRSQTNQILENGYDFIQANYTPGKGLLLDEILLTKPRLFYTKHEPNLEMPEHPNAKLIITTNDGRKETIEVDYDTFQGRRESFFMSDVFGEPVSVKELQFRIEPKENQQFVDGRIGVTRMMELFFNIEEGFTGLIDNRVTTDYKIRNDESLYTIVPTSSEAQHGNRQAVVLPMPEGTLPIAETKINLEHNYAGVIVPGKNTLNVEFNNTSGSLDRITNDYEIFLKIPNNVVLDLENIAHENKFNIKSAENIISDDHYSYYKIVVSGDKQGLLPGEGVKLKILAEVLDKGSSTVDLSVYGHSSTKDLLTPNYNGDAITNTVITPKDDDAIIEGIINGDNNYLKSENAYSLIKQEGLYTQKTVKGENDEAFSDFAHTSLGGKVEFKLDLNHNLDSSIKKMAIIDVLPSVNDLGITDNVERDSQFDLVLNEPIQLNDNMEQLFDVYYSKTLTPKRDDLSAIASNELENPSLAEDPNWMLASEVEDFTEINTIMIKLKDNKVWKSNAQLTVNFSMQAPDELAHQLISIGKDDRYNKEKAAWNSFAVAVNNLQVVEPSRVGVVVVDENLEIMEPSIDKHIRKADMLLKEDSVKLNEEIVFDIAVAMPESVNAYKSLTILDKLHDNFKLEAAFFNGTEVAVEEIFEEGLISYKLDRDDLHRLEKDGVKELVLTLKVKLDRVDLDETAAVIPVENTAKIIVNEEHEYDVEKPTIVTPDVPYGEITVVVTEGPNEIVERETVDDLGSLRLIGSNANLVSHPDNPFKITFDFTTKEDHEIMKLPVGKYIIKQNKVLEDYVITEESLVVEVNNGTLTVVEIINPYEPVPAKITAKKEVSGKNGAQVVSAGDTLTYTIIMTNDDEKAAHDIFVKDDLSQLIDHIQTPDNNKVYLNGKVLEGVTVAKLMNGFYLDLIEIGQTIELSFDVTLKNTLDENVTELVNVAQVNNEYPKVKIPIKPVEPVEPKEPGSENPKKGDLPATGQSPIVQKLGTSLMLSGGFIVLLSKLKKKRES